MTHDAVDFEALPSDRRDRHKENALLGEIFRATMAAADPASAVQRASEALRAFFATASVGLWVAEDDEIHLLGLSLPPDLPPEIAASIRSLFGHAPTSEDLPGTRAMRCQRLLRWRADDPALEKPIQDALASVGAGRLYAFPMMREGESVGCGLIALPAGRALDESDEAITWNVLGHVARLYHMLRRQPGSAAAPRPPGTAPVSSGAGPRPRILLADDDQVTAEVIRHRLGREGWDVLHYSSGDAAAAALADAAPDLCLVELRLPGLPGLELLERIVGTDGIPRPPVIVLTSLASDKNLARAFALGAEDYLLKPFSLLELTARVKRRLSVKEGFAPGS